MEKLIEKFDKLRHDGVIHNSILCAEEAKKLAIEFLAWIREYEGDSWLGEAYRIELFNKFLETYE